MDLTNACRSGDTERVRLLLLDGIDPTANNNRAIKYACHNGHSEVVKLLLEAGVDPSVDDNYPLKVACQNGRVEVVKVLLQDPRVDPSVDDNYALNVACQNGHVEVVKVLLAAGVDPSVNDNQPIQGAYFNNHFAVVKLLLEDERVDPSFEDNELIKSACRRGNIELVRLLLQDPRVDPSVNDNEPLSEACKGGFIEIVKLLLRHPRVSLPEGIISTACYGPGGPELVLLLLHAGADPSVNDNLALREACIDTHQREANPAVIRLLLSDPRVDPSVIHINMMSNPSIILLFRIRTQFNQLFQDLPEVTVRERRKKEDLGQKLKRFRDILTDEQRNYLDSYNSRLLRMIMTSEMDNEMMKKEILSFNSGKKSKNKKKYRKSKQ